jgi:hypothetical protein
MEKPTNEKTTNEFVDGKIVLDIERIRTVWKEDPAYTKEDFDTFFEVLDYNRFLTKGQVPKKEMISKSIELMKRLTSNALGKESKMCREADNVFKTLAVKYFQSEK